MRREYAPHVVVLPVEDGVAALDRVVANAASRSAEPLVAVFVPACFERHRADYHLADTDLMPMHERRWAAAATV